MGRTLLSQKEFALPIKEATIFPAGHGLMLLKPHKESIRPDATNADLPHPWVTRQLALDHSQGGCQGGALQPASKGKPEVRLLNVSQRGAHCLNLHSPKGKRRATGQPVHRARQQRRCRQPKQEAAQPMEGRWRMPEASDAIQAGQPPP